MGDRANVAIEDMRGADRERVYLYTHWGGSELPQDVQAALALRERWNDAPYLARIVFQTMLGEQTGTTGYGISASIGDNSYNVLVLDTVNQSIRTERENGDPVGVALPFDQYVALTPEQAAHYRDTGAV